MPYMRVSLTKTLTMEQKKALYDGLGAALSLIPSKEPYMLIAEIEDGKTIFSGGRPQENFVFVDARYFSRFDYHIKKAFVQGVFKAISDVAGTPPECISMTILEMSTWGGFGDLADENAPPEQPAPPG
jgi:phenylpyruvate tautomerase PptA (4-oxalocrotonate tautomerase family)